MDATGGLILIDPVRGFTDPGGSLGRLHGREELVPIERAVKRLEKFVGAHRGPSIWVRSVYRPGQFTNGQVAHPLGHLCADSRGFDCQWDEQLIPPIGAVVVTKHERDACSSDEFLDAFDQLVASFSTVLITGFLLTSCVEATAMSCRRRLGAGRISVAVSVSMTASRATRYRRNGQELSATERVLKRLHEAGVEIAP